jgi:Subtilase family
MSNGRSVFSGFITAHGARALCSALLFAAVVIVGCGETSKPNVEETCLADKPELRYWLRDRIAISVQLPIENSTLADQDVAKNVANALRDQAGTGLDFVAPLIRVGQNATIFYQLTGNNAKGKCDPSVLSAVNKINAALNPKVSRSELVGANQSLVIPSSELHPLSVSVGGQKVAVAGASPDWLLSGVSVGGDSGGGGHPGGPAKIPPSSFMPNDAKDLAVANSGDGGADTAVVVLDTGYKLGASHQAPVACPGAAGGQCAPAVQSVTLNPTVAAALGGLSGSPVGDLDKYLQESDMAVQTDTYYDVTNNGGQGLKLKDVPYEFTDANGDPALLVDHGLYISGLIHEAAPQAQIRLIRVLNDYGIGDLQSILIGVQTVAGNSQTIAERLKIDPKSNIVVNMSLGFGPPTDCFIGVWNHWDALQQAEDAVVQMTKEPSPANINCPTDKTSASVTPTTEANQPYRTPLDMLVKGHDNSGADAALTLPLSLAISNLRSVNTHIKAVVAAAGNESTPDIHLDADLPAAICGVIPVGATDVGKLRTALGSSIPPGLGLADFSNRPLLDTLPADNPRLCLKVSSKTAPGAAPAVTDPITVTFDNMSTPSMVAVGVKVCGVYASPVPPLPGTPSATPSPSHMALWDGTSFATGWASGYVARQGVPANGVFFVPDYQQCNSEIFP